MSASECANIHMQIELAQKSKDPNLLANAYYEAYRYYSWVADNAHSWDSAYKAKVLRGKYAALAKKWARK